MKKILCLIILVIAISMTTGCVDYFNEKEVECTVQDKWLKRSGEEDIYLIQCDDTVYKIKDLLLKGKFNSSDLYARLKKDTKYRLQVSGYRWQFFSNYQNINSYEEIKE